MLLSLQQWSRPDLSEPADLHDIRNGASTILTSLQWRDAEATGNGLNLTGNSIQVKNTIGNQITSLRMPSKSGILNYHGFSVILAFLALSIMVVSFLGLLLDKIE